MSSLEDSFAILFCHRSVAEPSIVSQMIKTLILQSEGGEAVVHILSMWDCWHRALAVQVGKSPEEMRIFANWLLRIDYKLDRFEEESDTYVRLLISVVEAGTINGSDLLSPTDMKRTVMRILEEGQPHQRHVFIITDVRGETDINTMEKLFSKTRTLLVRFLATLRGQVDTPSIRSSLTETLLDKRDKRGAYDLSVEPSAVCTAGYLSNIAVAITDAYLEKKE